jgi:hypothetical protein
VNFRRCRTISPCVQHHKRRFHILYQETKDEIDVLQQPTRDDARCNVTICRLSCPLPCRLLCNFDRMIRPSVRAEVRFRAGTWHIPVRFPLMKKRPTRYNVMLCETWCATMTRAGSCLAKHAQTSVAGQALVVLSVAQMTDVRICMLAMALLIALQHRRRPEALGSSGRAAPDHKSSGRSLSYPRVMLDYPTARTKAQHVAQHAAPCLCFAMPSTSVLQTLSTANYKSRSSTILSKQFIDKQHNGHA